MGLLMFAATLLATPGDIAVTTADPVTPAVRSETFRARCPGVGVEVRDYRMPRPARSASVAINGIALRGAVAAEVMQFLNVPGAAYRIAVNCPQRPGAVQLFLYRARRGDGDTPLFELKTLRFERGAAVLIRDEGAIAPADFFFR